MTWRVRVTAEIDDTIEVDLPADATDEEVIEAAHADWSFVEASSWGESIIDRPEEGEEDA